MRGSGVPRGAAACMLGAVLLACGGTRGAAEQAVRAYNDELVGAYRSSDASRMKSVAVRKEADRVLVLIDLKRASKLVLESALESSEVVAVVVTGENAATVETRERWRYHDRPLDPGSTPQPVSVAQMRMRYTVVREGAVWKVAEVGTLSNEFLEPRGHAQDARAGASGQGAPASSRNALQERP